MSADIIPFPNRTPPRNELDHDWRSDIPLFDYNNPAHVRAWETMFEIGRRSIADDWEPRE